MTKKKTSILERKINEDPLTWGTPEMIRSAKKRMKAGLPAALPVSIEIGNDTAGTATPSKATASSGNKHSNLGEKKHQSVASGESPYPKIRARYDLLIANVMASKGISQKDKKARVINLEIRYESEIQEKKYQKYTLWFLTGFLAVTAFVWYAKFYMI